ncbi:MAG: hypothetical protein A2622_12620 [Bdellovibrionales bacterium RIFCSPHIGHO2_01_FULL_40_29]|nr:MAG: hypothetical protein A2622_12620 [Bdellovibrionales bacterium RIFCSPHIGHO2_01_FULL_40_29]OFZ33462.1 MAG: hypothetical protein A3D17_14265 [Bdellovibrionales bacterium RIFCSPHIGHO2_02_FULL_40_15]
MFLSPLTLQDISQLRHPSERVPLAERLTYEDALRLIEEGQFTTCHAELHLSPLVRIEMQFGEDNTTHFRAVEITENVVSGPITVSCHACEQEGIKTCPHQWAAYVLLWQVLTTESNELKHPALSKLSNELKRFLFSRETSDSTKPTSEFEDVGLESISLYIHEFPLFQGKNLAHLLKQDVFRYKPRDISKDKEMTSHLLFELPEVFRKKLVAYSGHYLNEINKQNRLADIVNYNFSNDMQISAREILRHPLHKKISLDLLPQNKTHTGAISKWPLIQSADGAFISQAEVELEEIVQSLLDRVTQANRRGQIELYLQGQPSATMAMKITNLEFNPSQELDWRVEFSERSDNALETEFKLLCFRKEPITFFHSFAVEPKSGTVIVHPWFQEFNLLQEMLSVLPEPTLIRVPDMPTVNVIGEFATKTVLNYLRGRFIDVKISGESRHLTENQSATEIRLNESGTFYIQHEARVIGQKNLVRKGWSSKSALLFQTLSQGLAFILKVDAKDLAARTLTKREWDLKLLKNLGILQYLVLETMSVHFTGALSDGRPAEKDKLFTTLQGRIHQILISGPGETFLRDSSLPELCSAPVLKCFEDYIATIFKSIQSSESFYSENGEIILDGVVERECRVIFELLKQIALVTGGEVFKRARSPLLGRVSNSENEFFFPTGNAQKPTNLHESLECLQTLVPYGFKLFYKDQPLQELNEDEFHVDFVLETDRDQKMFNWFELNPKFFLRGEEVNPDQILNLGGGGVIEYAGKFYLVPQKQMPSLKRLERFWQRLQNGKTETLTKKNGEKIYKLPRNQTLELLSLRASGVGLRGDHEWKKLCDFYDNLGTHTPTIEIPSTIKGLLKPYQVLGVQWLRDLYELRLGALLADDMGLGKTLQTLTFLEILRSKNELGQVLIVVPSSLIFNWQQEIEKFTPNLPFMIFSGKNADLVSKKMGRGDQMLVITTYGLLMEHGDFLSQYKWRVAIYDEAQNLKNLTTKRTSAARALIAHFKICLTGTPMENHYGEFYSLVDLLVPGSLGPLTEFRRKFVNTDMITHEEMRDLKLKIRPLLLRRNKKEILTELPEKQETKISIAFEEKQKEIYRDIALSYNNRVKETIETNDKASVQLQMLTALLRLRQACSDPGALPNVKYPLVPPKLSTLLESVSEIVESGESALVFTQFLQTLEHTAKILRSNNIPVYVLHGAVPTKKRQMILAEFNANPAGSVLLMTLKTGGVGLNLTKASYVFHLEPWWNPAVENQASDRAHRLGQTKAVQVFKYIMHESLEEKIELLKHRKDKKFLALLDSAEKVKDIQATSGALSKEDFNLLLGIKS